MDCYRTGCCITFEGRKFQNRLDLFARETCSPEVVRQRSATRYHEQSPIVVTQSKSLIFSLPARPDILGVLLLSSLRGQVLHLYVHAESHQFGLPAVLGGSRLAPPPSWGVQRLSDSPILWQASKGSPRARLASLLAIGPAHLTTDFYETHGVGPETNPVRRSTCPRPRRLGGLLLKLARRRHR